MFEGCSNLTYIPSSFVLTDNNITNCENMFKDCTQLFNLEETFLLPSTTPSFRCLIIHLYQQFRLNSLYMIILKILHICSEILQFPTTNIRCSKAFENMPNLEMNISSLIHTEFGNTRNIDFYMTFKNTPGLSGDIPIDILWNSELHFTSRQCFKGCSGLAQEYENIETELV